MCITVLSSFTAGVVLTAAFSSLFYKNPAEFEEFSVTLSRCLEERAREGRPKDKMSRVVRIVRDLWFFIFS